jgi:hypothetical protein
MLRFFFFPLVHPFSSKTCYRIERFCFPIEFLHNTHFTSWGFFHKAHSTIWEIFFPYWVLRQYSFQKSWRFCHEIHFTISEFFFPIGCGQKKNPSTICKIFHIGVSPNTHTQFLRDIIFLLDSTKRFFLNNWR